MHLIEIFLPATDPQGRAFDAGLYAQIEKTLTEKFGGVTAFSRAPAKGLFKQDGRTVRDDIIVLEVMVAALDTAWWTAYRRILENVFQQDEILMRAGAVTRL